MLSRLSRRAERTLLAALLVVSLLPRVLLLPAEGAHGDLLGFALFGAQVMTHGSHALYDPSSIPPAYYVVPPVFPFLVGASYWVWSILHRISGAPVLDQPGIMTGAPPLALAGIISKCWAVAADLALAVVAYRWVRHKAGPGWAVVTAAALLFNLGMLYDSAWWGQIEAVLTLFLVLSVTALAGRHSGRAWVWWTVALLVKPQAVVAFPVLFAITLRRCGLRGLLRGGVIGAAVGIAIAAPFLVTGRLPLLIAAYTQVAAVHPLVTVNAYNVWWVLSGPDDWIRWHTDTGPFAWGMTFRQAGLVSLILYVATVLWGVRPLWFLHRQRAAALVGVEGATVPAAAPSAVGGTHASLEVEPAAIVTLGAALYLAFFMLPTQIHERYIYPGVVLLALVMWRHPLLAALYALFATTFTANIIRAAPLDERVVVVLDRLGATPWRVALVNLIGFGVCSALLLAWQHELLARAARRLTPLLASAMAVLVALAVLVLQFAPPPSASLPTVQGLLLIVAIVCFLGTAQQLPRIVGAISCCVGRRLPYSGSTAASRPTPT